ncbi:MAG: hypothetical protein ACI379_13650 [Nocardioides sp.]|uniref:hypothetical protein n=1 Tax=Nocardioides sp. TaxID=35761 RepID=UPI003F0FD410
MSGTDDTPDNTSPDPGDGGNPLQPGGQEPPGYGQQPPSYGQPYGGSSYGEQPPGGGGPYGAGPYGTPSPTGPQPYAVGEAIGYGWRKFTENVGPILLLMVIWLGASIAVSIVVGLATGGASASLTMGVGDDNWSTSVNPFGGMNFLASGIEYAATLAISLVGQAVVTKGALGLTQGRAFQLETALEGLNWGQLILATLILSVATSIGFMLCFLPGLVIALLTMFTLHFIIDKNLDALAAIKASYQLVTGRLGDSVLLAVVGFLVVLAGLAACCIGVVAALPVVVIATAFTFRRFLDEPVAA